jgi:hypothetical protein
VTLLIALNHELLGCAKCGRWKITTFWPVLQTLTVHLYVKSMSLFLHDIICFRHHCICQCPRSEIFAELVLFLAGDQWMVPVHTFILLHICPVVSIVYCIGRTLICNYWQVVILLLVLHCWKFSWLLLLSFTPSVPKRVTFWLLEIVFDRSFYSKILCKL